MRLLRIEIIRIHFRLSYPPPDHFLYATSLYRKISHTFPPLAPPANTKTHKKALPFNSGKALSATFRIHSESISRLLFQVFATQIVSTLMRFVLPSFCSGVPPVATTTSPFPAIPLRSVAVSETSNSSAKLSHILVFTGTTPHASES